MLTREENELLALIFRTPQDLTLVLVGAEHLGQRHGRGLGGK